MAVGKNKNPGSANALTDNQVHVLAQFDTNNNFQYFIGPGGVPFYLGSSGVNQLQAGFGISLSPATGVGIVQVTNTSPANIGSITLTVPSALTINGASSSTLNTSGVLAFGYGTGQIPVQNLGTGSYAANYYLNGAGVFAPAQASSIPYVSLNSGPVAAANIPFTSSVFAYYGDASQMTVVINGITLQPGVQYTLAGTTLTVLDYLEAGTTVEVISKQVSTTSLVPSLQQVTNSGSTTTNTISIAQATISNPPVANTDAVRLIDLQSAQVGLINFRPAVTLVATTSVGTTYTNNAGVGFSTITGVAPLVIDGVTPTVGQRVLLVNQAALGATAANVSNGPYVVTNNPTTGTFSLVRATDLPAYGNYYFVLAGQVYDSTAYINNTVTNPIVVGTTPIMYVQFFASPNAATNLPLPNGTGAIGASVRYAREDHVHDFSVSQQMPALVGSLTYTGGVLTYTPSTTTRFSGGTTGLTPSAITQGDITLGGVLNVANGGTGTSSLTANNLLVGAGTNAPTFIAPGSTGQALVSNGTTWNPGSPASLLFGSGSSQWTFSFSGTKAYFAYGGVNVMSVDSSGNILAKGNVTAFATTI